MPLDPEACGGLPARDSMALDRVDRERRKVTLAPLASARVSSVGERAGCRVGPGPECVPGRRSALRPGCETARSQRSGCAPTPQADLCRRGRPVAAVVAAVRAGSSGPKHFTIVLQNC